MNTKRILTFGCVIAMTVLVALGGTWQPAAAESEIVRLVPGQTIGLGVQGLHVTNIPRGVTHVSLENVGRDLPSRFAYKMDMQFRAPAMEVRFLDAKGGQVGRISAVVYVYFNITRAERDLWFKSGMQEIAIWFANEQTGSWQICPTYFVQNSDGEMSAGRLSCLAPGSGFYVLGLGDFSKYTPKPQALTSVKANSGVASHPTSLKVRAYVDGRSQLVIQGDRVYWHHLDFQAPGRWVYGGGSKPTYLNHDAWDPTWPDIPDETNQDCNCDSSSFEGIPSLTRTGEPVWLDIVQGRGAVNIIQQPNSANDYTLIIEFDDNPLDGAEWYEIDLDY